MKSISWGVVPSVDDLSDALDGEYDMDLKGQDSLAFDYAMRLAGISGSTRNAKELSAVLVALYNAPDPNDLLDEDLDEVGKILDRWDSRYGSLSIADEAGSLASSILFTLGWEAI